MRSGVRRNCLSGPAVRRPHSARSAAGNAHGATPVQGGTPGRNPSVSRRRVRMTGRWSIIVGMRKLAVVSTVILLAVAGAARADEVSKKAKIEELFQLTDIERMMGQVLGQVRSMQTAQIERMAMTAEARSRAREIQDRIQALIARMLSWERLKPQYVALYGETFTEEEIDGMLAFYRSPAGRAMREKMPALMKKSMELTQQMMRDIQPEMTKIMEEGRQGK
jgi:hypothetical protein